LEDPAYALRNLLKEKWDPDVALDERISENAMAFDTAKMNKDFKYPSIYVTMLTDTYTLLDMKTSALRRHYRVDGFLLMNIRVRPKTASATDFGQWKGLLWDLGRRLSGLSGAGRMTPRTSTLSGISVS